jgi:hypothetical protein
MFKQLVKFCIFFVIFGLAYGVSTQSLLYSNEWRITELIKGIYYVPYYSIYGDLFISERTSYGHAGDLLTPGDDCTISGNQETFQNCLIISQKKIKLILKTKKLICKKTSKNDIEGQRCPEKSQIFQSISVEVLHAAYMFIGHILLLNVLIALFTSTFDKVKQKAIQLYALRRYHQGPFSRLLKI